MRDLPIRKIPGVGRVNERLLDSIGIKVSCTIVYSSIDAYHAIRHVETFSHTAL